MTNNSYVQRALLEFAAYFSNPSTTTVTDVLVFLQIDFPILYAFEHQGNHYLVYTLNYHRFSQKEYNALIVQVPSKKPLVALAKGELGIFEVFDQYDESIYYVGLNETEALVQKIDLAEPVQQTLLHFTDVEEDAAVIIEDLLPNEQFYLTLMLPNQINLQDVVAALEAK